MYITEPSRILGGIYVQSTHFFIFFYFAIFAFLAILAFFSFTFSLYQITSKIFKFIYHISIMVTNSNVLDFI